MKPLLRLQSIPIKIEHKTQRQKALLPPANDRLNKAHVQTTPARVMIDSYETRASVGFKSAARLIEEAAQKGRAAAMEAARQYAEQGNQVVDSCGKGNPIIDIVASKAIKSVQTVMASIPSPPPEISVEPGSVSVEFYMDNPGAQIEYTPGSVSLTVSRYPRVAAEYIGEPNYFPPSSAP